MSQKNTRSSKKNRAGSTVCEHMNEPLLCGICHPQPETSLAIIPSKSAMPELEEKITPAAVLRQVEGLLAEVVAGEALLDVNWMKLGTLLESVQTHEYWREKHNSFGSYLMALQVKYKRGRSQLYNYIATAHALADKVTEAQLTEMGIAKARVLAEGVKAVGALPPAALTVALDRKSTAEDVREAIFKGTNTQEKGEWYPLSGFPVTKEERATLDEFLEKARRTDPAIPKSWKPWQVLKECLLRGAMEYNSTYADVETFEGEVIDVEAKIVDDESDVSIKPEDLEVF